MSLVSPRATARSKFRGNCNYVNTEITFFKKFRVLDITLHFLVFLSYLLQDLSILLVLCRTYRSLRS